MCSCSYKGKEELVYWCGARVPPLRWAGRTSSVEGAELDLVAAIGSLAR